MSTAPAMHGLPEHLIPALPKQAQELVRLIGFEATRTLIRLHGGTTLRLASGIGGERESRHGLDLAAVLGAGAAQTLARNYGGTELYVPNCKAAMTQVRDEALHAARDAMAKDGASERAIVTHLARTYHLSDRQVWRILKTVPLKAAPRRREMVQQGWMLDFV